MGKKRKMKLCRICGRVKLHKKKAWKGWGPWFKATKREVDRLKSMCKVSRSVCGVCQMV